MTHKKTIEEIEAECPRSKQSLYLRRYNDGLTTLHYGAIIPPDSFEGIKERVQALAAEIENDGMITAVLDFKESIQIQLAPEWCAVKNGEFLKYSLKDLSIVSMFFFMLGLVLRGLV